MYLGKGRLLPTFPFFDPDPDDRGDVTISWSRGGTSPIITKRLDKRFTWSGSNTDTIGWLGRYGEGRGAASVAELIGHHITTYGSHGGTDSGEASPILQAAIQEMFGISTVPPLQAAVDFGLANSEDGRPLDVRYWVKLLGRETPISQDFIGTRGNPIIVADDRFPPNHRMEVNGKWYLNDLREGEGRFPVSVTTAPAPAPQPTPTPPAPPAPPTSGRTINIDFNCTPNTPSDFIDIPPGTTRLDGDLIMVIPEDPRAVLLRHFTNESGFPTLNISNLRVSFFALRGNNTGSEKKPKRVLRWGFTQSAQLNARAEGDIAAKDGQLAGPRLTLPGVHRIRFTHLTATGGTTFTFSDGSTMKVVSKETGPLNSARFWLGTNLPADPADTSYIPPIGRITGSLTLSGVGQEPITPPVDPVNPIPGPITAADLTEARRIIRELQTELAALARVLG